MTTPTRAQREAASRAVLMADLAPLRTLAQERGESFEALAAGWLFVRQRFEQLRAVGLSDAQITQLAAEELGIPLDQMRQQEEQLRQRFGLT